MLKENLGFSSSKIEQLNESEHFLIVPIKEGLKTEKKLDKKSVLNLVLVLDRNEAIKRGSIALYTSNADQAISKLPENTFSKIFTYKSIDCDGQFKFLSITGRWNYQLTFKKGKLDAYGQVKQKSNTAGRIDAICRDWYLHTTYYVNGAVVDETWEYIGTTCHSDGCNSPDYMSLCADDGGGGTDYSDCCISDPNMQWTTSSISETISDNCGLEGVDPITGKGTKNCTHSWNFNSNTLLWYTWKYSSIETAELEKDAGIWKFKTVTHTGMSTNGTIPVCVNSNCTINSATPSISGDRSTAQMNIQYSISVNVSCLPWNSPTSKTGFQSTQWPAR